MKKFILVAIALLVVVPIMAQEAPDICSVSNPTGCPPGTVFLDDNSVLVLPTLDKHGARMPFGQRLVEVEQTLGGDYDGIVLFNDGAFILFRSAPAAEKNDGSVNTPEAVASRYPQAKVFKIYTFGHSADGVSANQNRK